MSASGKLKALAGPYSDEWDSGPYGVEERMSAEHLLAALLQIVAIIEAAEALPMLFDVIEGSTIKTLSFVPLLDELDKALS